MLEVAWILLHNERQGEHLNPYQFHCVQDLLVQKNAKQIELS